MPYTQLFIPHKTSLLPNELEANNSAIERHINDAAVSVQVIASAPTVIAANLGFTQLSFDLIVWDYANLAIAPPFLTAPGNGLYQVNATVQIDQTLVVGGIANGIAVAATYGFATYKAEPSGTITSWNFSRQFFMNARDTIRVDVLQAGGAGTFTAQILNLDMFYVGPPPRQR